MRSSSPFVGALAAALAGAQSDLVNPERTATGVLPPTRPGGESRIFRYATLSAGLDIVRHALSRREIAFLQTTFVDREVGWLRLQSVLAHASGEWIASDWPVCPLSVAQEPHRLGAAMTYARRYALFALIGIAGDDDLDAPDLEAASAAQPTSEPGPPSEVAGRPSAVRPDAPRDGEARSLRLIREIAQIGSEEELWRWAYWRIVEKDALPRALAVAVERRFAERVRDLQAETPQEIYAPDVAGPALEPAVEEAEQQDDVADLGKDGRPARDAGSSEDLGQSRALPAAARNDLLRLPPPRPVTPKTLRLRDKAHLEAIRHHPCLVCGRTPADPHHLRFAQPRATGRKSSDEFVVPLCRLHHDEVHKRGDERAWWQSRGIDPLPIALALWRQRGRPLEIAEARD